MLVQTIEDALEFLADWHGLVLPPWAPRPDAGLPTALVPVLAASRVMGEHLLILQDEIYREPRPRDDGITWLIRENQGVWVIGYRPEAPDAPLVTGDWLGALDEDFNPYGWNTLDMTTEDAMIQTVLINGWFALSETLPRAVGEPEVIPAETDLLLWSHPAGEFAFWTNAARSRFYFDGVWTMLTRCS